ncbi:MAG: hypothetical protein EOM29_09185 [Bacteroidia bacterium]|nr:hypothetical protein [Bacteroidia bacterium]
MEIKWIKITTNIFDDEKIQLIEAMPDSDTIIVIWFKLLALAGKSNNGGLVMFNEKVPFTIDMLTTLFRRKQTVVELALNVFERFEMIEILDNRTILISNWEKHQNIEGMDKIREQNRIRKQRQRQLETMSRDSHTDVTQENKNKKEELDIDLERDKELKESFVEVNTSMSVDTDEPLDKIEKIDYKSICDYWNKISKLKEISKITDQRKGNINARIKEYSVDEVYKMIDQASNSPFLRGDNKMNFIASFDWCFKPNNFVKVLEGNYLENGGIKRTFQSDIDDRVRKMKEYMGR